MVAGVVASVTWICKEKDSAFPLLGFVLLLALFFDILSGVCLELCLSSLLFLSCFGFLCRFSMCVFCMGFLLLVEREQNSQ